jgi:hypothetical protein
MERMRRYRNLSYEVYGCGRFTSAANVCARLSASMLKGSASRTALRRRARGFHPSGSMSALCTSRADSR